MKCCISIIKDASEGEEPQTKKIKTQPETEAKKKSSPAKDSEEKKKEEEKNKNTDEVERKKQEKLQKLAEKK